MKYTVVFLLLLATVLGSIGYGRAALKRQQRKTIADWAVGGRSMGTLIFWFMNAGEIYTTFAVFGIVGFAWAMGAPAYLAFCSISLSYAIGYVLMPKIWRAGRSAGLVTQADFFAARYDAPWLGVLTGVVGIASLVIYVQIQLVALSLIVALSFDGALSSALSVVVAGALMVIFVLAAGLRSAAFAAGVKDIMMIVLMVVLAATVASKVGAGSMFDIFDMVENLRPGIGKLPGSDPAASTTTIWLMTAALNVALGNWIFPNLFQVSYSAISATAIRRNAIWQPLYSLAYFFIILLGFAALVADTQPPGGNMNAVLLTFVSTQYPDWVIGLLAGTGVLLALVPGSVMLLTAGAIFTRNIVTPFCPALGETRALGISRAALIVFAALAVWLSMDSKNSLVSILLQAYSAIGMLGPGVFLAFLWKRTTAWGVLAGIVTGFTALLAPFAQPWWEAWFAGWEVGLIAMIINAATVVVVSLITPRPTATAVDLGLRLHAHQVTHHG